MKLFWIGAVAVAMLGVAVITGANSDAQQPVAKAPDAKVGVVAVTDASFGCIRKMTAVRGFYVSNLLGNSDATVRAASSTTGAVYPVGSLVQLVPTEAMVKREAGFNPATKDWEFFELAVTPQGTKIGKRGAGEVVNRFGGNCLSCHAAAKPEFDMICEQTHGCAPIPVTPVMAKAIQNTDPRCEAMQLPPEQAEALKALMAATRAAPAPQPSVN